MVLNKYLKVACLLMFLGNAFVVKGQMTMSAMHHSSAPSKNIFLSIMDTMMVKMSKVLPGTTVETDFLYQMIPHHEGAIAMAHYEIDHGKDFDMVQLAKSILVEQSSEVEQMHIWLSQLKDSATDLHTYHQEMDGTMKMMMDTMPREVMPNIDQAFARVMIPHHQAAVDMARVLLKYTRNATIAAYGNQLISNEQIEIEQMKAFLN